MDQGQVSGTYRWVQRALFGGAAGGGKRDALLMAALQYVHEPNYAAIIFRKSYRDLAQPGAIMDRIKSWHSTWTRELGLEANWHEQDKVMTLPSGARIVFAHLAYENEKYKYQGAEYTTRPAGPTQGWPTARYAHLAEPGRGPGHDPSEPAAGAGEVSARPAARVGAYHGPRERLRQRVPQRANAYPWASLREPGPTQSRVAGSTGVSAIRSSLVAWRPFEFLPSDR